MRKKLKSSPMKSRLEQYGVAQDHRDNAWKEGQLMQQ
jgi:hypothetical protein